MLSKHVRAISALSATPVLAYGLAGSFALADPSVSPPSSSGTQKTKPAAKPKTSRPFPNSSSKGKSSRAAAATSRNASTTNKPASDAASTDRATQPASDTASRVKTAPLTSDSASKAKTTPPASESISPATAAVHYVNLAKRQLRMLNFRGALKEYDKALTLDPKNMKAHGGRALIHAYLGDYEAAVKDVQRGLAASDPPDPDLMFCGGYAYLALGDGSRAATEFWSYLNQTRWKTSEALYAVIGQCLGIRQDGKDTQAAKILDDAAARIVGTGWPVPVLQYLSRKLTADELFALAKDDGQLTEAHCYVGVDLAQSGKPAAKDHLEWVLRHGEKTYLEYFLSRAWLKRLGQNLNVVLQRAIQAGDEVQVKELLANGATLKASDGGDQNPLIDAAIHNHIELVKLFLDKGIDPNFKDQEGRTALYFVAGRQVGLGGTGEDDAAIARLLLDRGANVNSADRYGITPLMNAAKTCNVPVVKLLLERHADVNSKVTSDKTDPAFGAVVARQGDTVLSMAKGKVSAPSEERRETIHLLEVSGAH